MSRFVKIHAGILALGLGAVAAPAAAQESLPARAVALLGEAIAAQGNAALVQLRDELKRDLLKHIQPYLPEHPQSAPKTPSAPASEPR